MRVSRPRSTPEGRHRPVLLEEVVAALNPRPGNVIVDCTTGAGGHSAELLARISPGGLLVGMDFDSEILPQSEATLAAVGGVYHLRQGNFAGLPTLLAELGVEGVHGLVADLGMSSPQVDDAERGFSFVRDGPLDMRMDRRRGESAAALLQRIPQEELAAAFREWGDEPAGEQIAAAIKHTFATAALERTSQLADVVRNTTAPGERQSLSPRQGNLASLARVFQTIRILVNREFANLDRLLAVVPSLLVHGGRAAFISFHSGEDRRVKRALRDGLRGGHYSRVSEEPIRASIEESNDNPRARSAKLRWAERSGMSAT